MRPLRVMSFNIRGFCRENDGINAWPNRAGLNAATIRRNAPDLIGFQELREANLQTYRKHLPPYAHLPGPAAGNQAPHEYNAILFDPARLEALDHGGFWLSKTPRRRSSGWLSKTIRSANWARFKCRATGLTFLHLNTHLDHVSALARYRSAGLILREIAKLRGNAAAQDLPVLLTGDFNCSPGSRPYRAFARSGFVDAYLATAAENGAHSHHTFHAFGGRGYRVLRRAQSLLRGGEPGRIDWILLGGRERSIKPLSARIVRDGEEPGLYPSDHFPVLAELTIAC